MSHIPLQADPSTARDLPDERLLAECRRETFRASGPGGQKRNKTSSAVRLVHLPTSLSAIANESRSQARNRDVAFARLRHRLAIELRRGIDAASFSPPPGLSLAVGMRSAEYLPALALALDVLAAADWAVSSAASLLRISTAQLDKFLRRDEKAWAKVNQMRQQHGLRALA